MSSPPQAWQCGDKSRFHDAPHDPQVMVIVSPERLPATSSASPHFGQERLFTGT